MGHVLECKPDNIIIDIFVFACLKCEASNAVIHDGASVPSHCHLLLRGCIPFPADSCQDQQSPILHNLVNRVTVCCAGDLDTETCCKAIFSEDKRQESSYQCVQK